MIDVSSKTSTRVSHMDNNTISYYIMYILLLVPIYVYAYADDIMLRCLRRRSLQYVCTRIIIIIVLLFKRGNNATILL